MSIILKGIDLPKNYNEPLMVEIYSDGDALATTKEMSGYDKTEAIQIPKGHGRIGDLDEVKRKGVDDGYDFYVSWTDIDNAPTILEAEE